MALPKKLWSLKDKLEEIAKKEKVEKPKKTKKKKTMKTIKSKAKSLAILLLGVALVGGTVMAYNGIPKVVVEGDYIEAQSQEQSLGAFPGPEIYQDVTINGDLAVTEDFAVTSDVTFSGEVLDNVGVVTQASTTNETLTQAQICDSNYIAYTPINSLTLTLPATSTISSCLSTAGATRSIVIENAATTTNNITLAAGTGMDLQEPDGQNVVIGQNGYAWITMVKLSNGDVVTRVDETIQAD